MATINDEGLIKRIVEQDGYYADDERVLRIVEYTNAWGKVAYGIEYRRSLGKYKASEYVIDPRVYWEVGLD